MKHPVRNRKWTGWVKAIIRAAVLLIFVSNVCDASESWLGEVSSGEEPTLFQLLSDFHGKESSDAVTIFGVNPQSEPLSSFSMKNGDLKAEFKINGQPAILNAVGDANKMHGEIQVGASKLSVLLQRLAAPTSANAKDKIFRAADGTLFWVGHFGEFGCDRYFLDFSSGRFGVVFTTLSGDLILGQSIVAPFFPVNATISLRKSEGESQARIAVRRDGEEPKFANEFPLQRIEVGFRNGDVSLKGTVTRPTAAQQLPAIVLLHGSGPEDRNYLGPWIGFFATQGYAVLAYDKRGVGESMGDWKQSCLEDLAGDAIAAVNRLKGVAGVNPARIGLAGRSQGGWIAPQVAAAIREVKFIILHGGPTLTVAEEDLAAFRGELEGYGFPQEDIAEAIKYRELDNAVTTATADSQTLQNRYQELKSKGVEWLIVEPRAADDWFRIFYRRILDFDPAPFWQKVSVPVLALYGERDRSVPPSPNAERLKKLQAANPNLKIVRVSGANHLMLECKTGVQSEYPSLKRFEPKYFIELADWLAHIQKLTARHQE